MEDPERSGGGDPAPGPRRARGGTASVSPRVVDEARNVRRLAVGALAKGDVAALFALRSVAIRDEDAEVRALATLRLREVGAREIGGDSEIAACRAAVGEAVADALRDESPLVREAAARTAAALREPRAEEPLRTAIRRDPAWQVRRAAVRALAAIAGERSAEVLFEALGDPFWRVRYAAIQALAAWPDVPLPADVGEARVAAALEYIESIRRGEAAADEDPGEPVVVRPDPIQGAPGGQGVSPRSNAPGGQGVSPRSNAPGGQGVSPRSNAPGGQGASPGPAPAAATGAAPDPLADDDPAVVAARLSRSPPQTAPASLLIAALASPHDSLRRVAVRALAARADPEEIAAALPWLDDPRTPYAGDATRRLLRSVDARPLCDRVLSEVSPRPGALAWALDLAARDARRTVPHVSADVVANAAEKALAHPEPSVRRAAVRALAGVDAREGLLRALADPDEAIRAEAVCALEPAIDDPAVRAALDSALARPATSPDPDPDHAASAGLFVTRALLGVLRVWLGREMDPATSGWITVRLQQAAYAPWTDVRAEAITLRARRGELDPKERAGLSTDPDPWIREAAMDAERGARALAEDRDPFVRRAAARLALAPSAPKTLRAEAAALGARSRDPWIRAKAAGALDTRTDGGLAALLCLSRDPAPMVRAAAADALGRTSALLPRCMRAVRREATPEDVRLAAHARLAASPTEESFAALVADIRSPRSTASARDTLRAIALVYPASLRAPAPPAPQTAPARHASTAPPPEQGLSTQSLSTSPRSEHRSSTQPTSAQPLFLRPERRPLGATGLHVAPLGLSGAGELPPACFAEARAAGVNLFFWEPGHRSLTTFVARSPRRHDLVIVTGSYEADRRSIERDVDRALTRLRIDSIGVMLLFWVRSRARLAEGACDTLLRLKQQGKVRAIGFSTHFRDLAAEAIAARPWDVVMCRLSAAHPGAEHTLLPTAAARGTGVIAFSALSYGRLLAPQAAPPVTAPDCYRYALSQPAVSVCLSAPRRFRELAENLEVLSRPTLPEPELARLRAHGARVHDRNRSFAALVHKR